MVRLWIFVLCSLSLNLAASFKTTYSDVIEIKNRLLQNYSREVIPRLRPTTDQLDLNLTVVLRAINNFDDVSGILQSIVDFHMSWTDELLRWESHEFDVNVILAIPFYRIWTPPLALVNSGSDEFNIDYGEETKSMADVDANGKVNILFGKVLTSTCFIDMTRYPLDKHVCTIQLTTNKNKEAINIIPDIDTSLFMRNAEWEFLNASTRLVMAPNPIVEISITLSRHAGSLFMGLILPIFLLGVTNLFNFIIPIDSGERISFSMTVLLSFAVFLTLVSEKMPQSAKVSYVCMYLGIMLLYSCLIALFNIVIVRINFAGKPTFSCMDKCWKRQSNTIEVIQKEPDSNDERARSSEEDSKLSMDNSEFCRRVDIICLVIFSLYLFGATTAFLVQVTSS